MPSCTAWSARIYNVLKRYPTKTVDPAVMFQETSSLVHTVIYTVHLHYVFVWRCPTVCTLHLTVKVKVTLVQALKLCTGRTAHRGSRGIALLFHDHGTKRGWGISVTPRPLFTPGKDPVPIVRYMPYRFAVSRPAWHIIPSYCCVYSEKLLMMDRGTVRNM